MHQTQEAKTEIDTGDAKIYTFPPRYSSPDVEEIPVDLTDLWEEERNLYANYFSPNLTYPRDPGNPSLKEFWERLYGTPESEGYLNIFSGERPPNLPEKKGEVNKNKLINIREKSFRFPEEVDQAAEWVRRESEEEREVYQCAHLLNQEKRNKENALSPITLYADGDGATIPDWMPRPRTSS